MNLTIPFLVLTGASIVVNYLDWSDTVKLIAKAGLASEKNPIMRMFFGISKWAALAYKGVSPAIFIYGGLFFKGGDVENFLVQYVNAPKGQLDHWALAWSACAATYFAFGLWGYLNNKAQLAKLK